MTIPIGGSSDIPVTLTSVQTITGQKTFTEPIIGIVSTTGYLLGSTGFETLAAAVTTLNGNPGTVYFTSDTATNTLTIPATMEIVPLNGAIITVNSGQVLDYQASTSRWPDNAQIFAGAGTVTGLKELRSAWRGGKEDTSKSYGSNKIWRRTYGIKDTGAAVSITSGSKEEPTTQVLGTFGDPSQASVYSGRDSVGLFTQSIAQPALLSTSNTTFTSTSVTSADIASVLDDLRVGMLIDVTGSPKITGAITDFTTNTITVSNWYLVDGSQDTTTPANGSTIKINPTTKIWGQNTNVEIPVGADANGATALEIGLLPYKTGTGQGTVGVDVAGLAGENAYAGFLSRGSVTRGYVSRAPIYGFLSMNSGATDGASEMGFWAKTDGTQSGSRINFYSQTGKVGFQSAGDVTGVAINDPTTRAIKVSISGAEKFAIDQNGNIVTLHYLIQQITTTTTISIAATIIQINGVGITATLPTAVGNAGKVYHIRNFSNASTVDSAGGNIDGASSVALSANQKITVYSDNTNWFTM